MWAVWGGLGEQGMHPSGRESDVCHLRSLWEVFGVCFIYIKISPALRRSGRSGGLALQPQWAGAPGRLERKKSAIFSSKSVLLLLQSSLVHFSASETIASPNGGHREVWRSGGLERQTTTLMSH